jgi:uncharacterized sulfatase
VPFLGPRAGEPRRYLYGIRDRMDERYDMSRTVRDRRYKYHRHYFPCRPLAPWLDYMEKLPTMQEWRRLDAEGKLSGVQAFFMRGSKPVEELYDVQADPDEQVNLAGSPEHREVLARMRAAHCDWARQTLDLGLLPEQDMRDRARGSSEYEMARQGPEVFPFERIFETAILSGEGAAAVPKLLDRSLDEDPAVRFWAVIGLTNAAGEDMSTATLDEPAVRFLRKTLADPSAEVRIAAAEALCRIGREKSALPVLIETLSHESPWVRLEAAGALDRIGEKARPAVAALRKAAADQGKENMFIRWVVNHTLSQLGE